MTIPWGAIGSWLGSNAGTLLNTGMAIYGANQTKDATKQAAAAATPTPYSSSSMWGNVGVDPRTRTMSYSMAQNPFAQMMQYGGLASMANAYSAPGSAYYGAAPEVAAAAAGMGGEAQAAEAANRYGLLNQLAQPEENRVFQRMENNLFARGQMGTSGGGEAYRGYEEARQQADLQRQLAAQDWAQSRGITRFNTARDAVGTGMAGQANQWAMGQQSVGGIQDMFQMLMQQANAGIGAGGGTPGTVALANANASTLPFQTGAAAVQNSGIFDQIGGWLGGLGGSTNGSYNPGQISIPNSGAPAPAPVPQTIQLPTPVQPQYGYGF